MLAGIDEIGLARSGLRMHVIFPPCRLRQTHENTFNATTGLEAKYSSAIIDEVELHVPSSSHQLPLLLLLGEIIILVLLHDGSVRLDNRVERLLAEFKNGVRISVVEIVEENSAQTASFVAVLDDKIPVSPRLELGIELRIVLVAHLLVGAVEMLHVVLVDVSGSNVGTAAEPPHYISLSRAVKDMIMSI